MKKTTAAIASALVVVSAGAVLRSGNLSSKAPAAETEMPFVIKKNSQAAADAPAVKIGRRGPVRAKAMDVPFIEDFSSSATLGDWGIQDVNNDGNSWEYKENWGLVRCAFPTSADSNDDWLVSPAINLGKDDIYTLTFSFGSQGGRFSPEKLTVTMGQSEYATQHTTVLFSRDDIQNFWNGSMETVTVTLPVEQDGAYYFGFHCGSPASGYSLYLDDVKVEQNGSYSAPAAVGDLTAVAGEKGALTARISMTAPDETADGDPLGSLDDVKLFCDETLVHTFESPAPGEELSFDDSRVTNGFHTYKAVATASGLEGSKAEVKLFVGVDAPTSVTNLRATEGNGSVSLSWDAPASVNGGYVGADVVRYKVVRIDSEGETELDSRWDETTLTDTDVDFSKQNHLYYTVEAFTSTGTAEAVASNSLFVGPAFEIPFREDFSYCALSTSPWVMEHINPGVFPSQWHTTAMGSYPVCPPIDGDDGMLEFVSKVNGFNLYAGNVIRLASPAIDLSDTSRPFVSFYLFHYDTTETYREYDQEKEEYVTVQTTYNDKLHLQVALDNGDYQDVPDSEILLAKDNSGWNLYTFPLDAYKSASKVSVALVGTADGGGNICVDRFLVSDTYDNDLEMIGLLGPSQVNVGEKAEYVANIVNNGTASTKDYTVDLYVDGVKVDSKRGQGAAIFANGGEKTVTLEFTPGHSHGGAEHSLYAEISFGADECVANNRSEVKTLVVPGSVLPRVESLDGSMADGVVSLTWEEPEMTGVRPPVTDNMEAYETFAISGMGDYTLVDNDKASKTYVVSGISGYPNAGAAMAWQVFDPKKAGIDTELDFNRRWISHSGSQSLVCWGADVSTGVTANDDWLISPELSGDAQKVTFYIKSVTMAYPERFRVLYSTDSKSTSDFVKVAEANYYTPTSYWRKFSVNLPEGTHYFAIHCISADAFGLMVDDMTFVPASSGELSLDFMGYNVYRDGEKINAEPLGEPSFTDTPPAGAAHEYYVTTLFPEGESSPSPSFKSAMSGISLGMADAEPEFTVRGHIGCIEVNGCRGLVEVYTIDGRLAARENVAGNLTFSVAAGTYVVRNGSKALKAVVR